MFIYSSAQNYPLLKTHDIIRLTDNAVSSDKVILRGIFSASGIADASLKRIMTTGLEIKALLKGPPELSL